MHELFCCIFAYDIEAGGLAVNRSSMTKKGGEEGLRTGGNKKGDRERSFLAKKERRPRCYCVTQSSVRNCVWCCICICVRLCVVSGVCLCVCVCV